MIACDAATFQPFVRSRYSLRRRITTETTPLKENKIITTDSNLEDRKHHVSNVATEIIIADPKPDITTETNLIKQGDSLDLNSDVGQKLSSSAIGRIKTKSTPPPDYDYYGNGDTEDIIDNK